VFVSITRCDTRDSPAEDGPIVGEEMDSWLRELEGYRGLMLITRPGEALGLAFWESEELAERHGALRAEFRERMLTIAGVTIESVDGYGVSYSRVEGL
jgi:hypothetical protein